MYFFNQEIKIVIKGNVGVQLKYLVKTRNVPLKYHVRFVVVLSLSVYQFDDCV